MMSDGDRLKELQKACGRQDLMGSHEELKQMKKKVTDDATRIDGLQARLASLQDAHDREERNVARMENAAKLEEGIALMEKKLPWMVTGCAKAEMNAKRDEHTQAVNALKEAKARVKPKEDAMKKAVASLEAKQDAVVKMEESLRTAKSRRSKAQLKLAVPLRPSRANRRSLPM